MRKAILVLTIIFFAYGTTNAQFQAGKSHVGPALGFKSMGIPFGTAFSLGANYEYGMKIGQIPGLIGGGAVARYWGKNDNNTILFALQGNYHLKIGDGKVDPFGGLVLGYRNNSFPPRPVNINFITGDYDTITSDGGIWFDIQIGARYWFAPNMAVSARIGAVNGFLLDLGFDIKF